MVDAGAARMASSCLSNFASIFSLNLSYLILSLSAACFHESFRHGAVSQVFEFIFGQLVHDVVHVLWDAVVWKHVVDRRKGYSKPVIRVAQYAKCKGQSLAESRLELLLERA